MTLRHALRELMKCQEEVDRESFSIHGRGIAELSADDVVRHDVFHMAKAVAKMADYCDRREHDLPCTTEQLREEVVPDLLVYSLQLARALEVDLGDCYERRLEYVRTKLYRAKA